MRLVKIEEGISTFEFYPQINHVGDIMLSVPGHPANQAEHSCKSNFPTQEFSIEVTTNFNQEKTIDQIRLIGTHLKLHYNPDSRSSSFTARVVVGEKCCQPWVYKTTISFSIEGLTFGQVYEPESELRTDFIWNKTDLYGQRVYGKSVGVLEVCFHGREAGCHRKDCQSINVELDGHNPHKRGMQAFLEISFCFNNGIFRFWRLESWPSSQPGCPKCHPLLWRWGNFRSEN